MENLFKVLFERSKKKGTYKDTVTENGMPTHSTSGNSVLDLFYKMGGSRKVSVPEFTQWVINAYNEDPLLTLKCLFYLRDIRGGMGERESFRYAFRWLSEYHPEVAKKNLELVPEYGRWDDVFVTIGTSVEKDMVESVTHELALNNALLAKWMPREGKRLDWIAKFLMKELELTPKFYRRALSNATHVVESQMCKQDWGEINYNHVPSLAMTRYRKAFGKHDYERFSQWLNDLSKPESGAKIHADTLYPHDLVYTYLKGSGWYRPSIGQLDKVVEEQWKVLPDYLNGKTPFIPVCDVSGSMDSTVSSEGKGVRCIDVSISLGLYLAERNKSAFKDSIITFSREPHFIDVSGETLKSRVEKMLPSRRIAENTNLEGVFDLILTTAKRYSVPKSDMPNTIILLSDMQFDESVSRISDTAMQMIRRKYSGAGYEVPNVVFWNLRTSSGVPVKLDESGTALVSGFSPSIMKNLLGGALQPLEVMLKTLNSERYSKVTI